MGNNLTIVDLGANQTAVKIELGFGHSCALLDNGQIKCWGSNDYGQLGMGDNEPRGDEGGEMGDSLPSVDLGTGRTAVEISVGVSHGCARLDNG